MEELSEGRELDMGTLAAATVAPGTALLVGPRFKDSPIGQRYRALWGTEQVRMTIVDPLLVARADVRAQCQADLERAARISHRNVVPILAAGPAGSRFVVIEPELEAVTVRAYADERSALGQALDLRSAYTIVAHVCNALQRIHEDLLHGFVTADTVVISPEGRVLLSCLGLGHLLPRAPAFTRFRKSGLLPNVAPEQLRDPPIPDVGTDVFAVAALYLELATGHALLEAGQPLSALDLGEDSDLRDCLERATAPSLSARPPDIETFKHELQQAIDAVLAEPIDPDVEAVAVGPPAPLPPSTKPAAPRAPGPGYPHHGGHHPPFGYGPPGFQTSGPLPSYAGHLAPSEQAAPWLGGYGHGHAPPGAWPPGGPPPPQAPQPPPPQAPQPSPELQALDAAMRRLTEGLASEAPKTAHAVEEPVARPTVGAPEFSLDEVGSSQLATVDGLASRNVPDFEPVADPEPQTHEHVVDQQRRSSFVAAPTAVPGVVGDPDDSADQRPVYLVDRNGIDEGPYSVFALARMLDIDDITPTTQLRRRDTMEELAVEQLPALGNACRRWQDRQQIAVLGVPGRRAEVRAPPPAPTPSPDRGRALVTLLWVALVLGGFAVAAWMMLQR